MRGHKTLGTKTKTSHSYMLLTFAIRSVDERDENEMYIIGGLGCVEREKGIPGRVVCGRGGPSIDKKKTRLALRLLSDESHLIPNAKLKSCNTYILCCFFQSNLFCF